MSPKQKDPSISKLNDLGYNVIKVPRTDIAPLDLLAHDASSPQLRKIGTISTFWKTAAPIPVPGPPSAASSLNNTHSNKLELGFGLDLLKGALAVFGASAPSLDLSHTSARSLQFNYTGVTTVSIDTGLIGDYLTEGTLNVGNPETKHRFLDEGSQVYIITEVIRSTSITVTATDDQGNGVSLSAPEINGIVGGNVSVKPSSATNSAITFESATTPPTAANFGFKAMLLTWQPTPGGALGSGTGTWAFADADDITFAAPVLGRSSAAAAESTGPVVFETGPESCLLDL
ncbi:gasdermin [Granulicella aggregans]|jgi:hypothetical protein|uniref:gasdermin n=1 Tax=Granulicella aggregans TaxID=474949 RepID=UPI0021DF512A|nr:hypothetical protein [Granulicella aggregans]